jgi:hypothetical protein
MRLNDPDVSEDTCDDRGREWHPSILSSIDIGTVSEAVTSPNRAGALPIPDARVLIQTLLAGH